MKSASPSPEREKPFPEREPEYSGSIWKHPYVLYIMITVPLFLLLILMAWLAVKNGWLPDRGTMNGS